MNAPLKIALFTVALGAVFGGAWAIGSATDLVETAEPEHGAHAEPAYELALGEQDRVAGRNVLTFQVRQDDRPVTAYDVQHEKRLHLIAVRRDLAGYQHVHPTLSEGTWSTELALLPGRWRIFADFKPTGGDAQVLTADLDVPGEPGPDTAGTTRAETRSVSVNGYDVTLRGDLTAGGSTVLTPSITRAGKPVEDLQPYLGALGHLVALRHGTLDYLHVHPEGLDFHTEVTKPGRYELFLEFKHEGRVHRAQFTLSTKGARGDEPTEVEHDEHSH